MVIFNSYVKVYQWVALLQRWDVDPIQGIDDALAVALADSFQMSLEELNVTGKLKDPSPKMSGKHGSIGDNRY